MISLPGFPQVGEAPAIHGDYPSASLQLTTVASKFLKFVGINCVIFLTFFQGFAVPGKGGEIPGEGLPAPNDASYNQRCGEVFNSGSVVELGIGQWLRCSLSSHQKNRKRSSTFIIPRPKMAAVLSQSSPSCPG